MFWHGVRNGRRWLKMDGNALKSCSDGWSMEPKVSYGLNIQICYRSHFGSRYKSG